MRVVYYQVLLVAMDDQLVLQSNLKFCKTNIKNNQIRIQDKNEKKKILPDTSLEVESMSTYGCSSLIRSKFITLFSLSQM